MSDRGDGEIEEHTNQPVEKAQGERERERERERSTCTCRFVMNAEAELASAVVRRGFEERTCFAIHAFMHPTAKVPDAYASLARELDLDPFVPRNPKKTIVEKNPGHRNFCRTIAPLCNGNNWSQRQR